MELSRLRGTPNPPIRFQVEGRAVGTLPGSDRKPGLGLLGLPN